MQTKPVVLTIAGFDPSGCAGILADIKTFEANGVYGMAVCTANTEQSVTRFNKPNWVPEQEILVQLNLLLSEQLFGFVKIGLIENFEFLNRLLTILKKYNPQIKIVWDPVCSASASFTFHSAIKTRLLEEITRKVYLITPNRDEVSILVPDEPQESAAKTLAQNCYVLLKGGHVHDDFSTDILLGPEGVVSILKAERLKNFNKRGTGCVLSAAITANLAKGATLEEACRLAKDYVTAYLKSNDSLTGYHRYESQPASVHNR